MRVQRAGKVGERSAFRAVAGISRQVGRAIADRVVTPRADASALRAPGQQLFAHVTELGAQVAGRAARTARSPGPARAMLVQVVADRQQQSLGFWIRHRSIVAAEPSRHARAS